jgi:hypothetical protein
MVVLQHVLVTGMTGEAEGLPSRKVAVAGLREDIRTCTLASVLFDGMRLGIFEAARVPAIKNYCGE